MKRRIKLTFPQHLIREPIIFSMAKNYDIMPNIRRARVTDLTAEMILDLEGLEANIDSGIAALQAEGVTVEAIEGETATQ